MLLERIDELPLRHHDLRGNPSALLGSIVAAHRPPQGRARHRRATTRAWAGDAARGRRARCARARVRRALRRPRPLARARPGRSTSATWCCTPSGCCATKPHVRARLARALPPRARRRAAGRELRPGPAAAAARRPSTASITAVADDDQAIHRFRGAATKNMRDFRADWPDATVVRAGGVLPLPGARSSRPRRRSSRRSQDRLRRRRSQARPAARSRSGAARTSARRRRRSPPRSSG